MRLWPQSLFARLLALSTAATLAALVFAGLAIGHVLERVVIRQLDDRLDAQVAVLARAIRPDGTLDPARAIALPGFDRPGSGWTWQVSGPGAAIAAMPAPRDGREPRPGEGRGRRGERLHTRTLAVPTPAGEVLVTAAGPRRIVAAPLREAMVPLLGSLALLGAALAAASLVQLRLGLRPLGRLRAALVEVRAGRQRHVDDDQPNELRPLVTELNALIDQNEAGLANARAHVANLAHGLKTPLAALALELAGDDRDPDGALRARVAEIDARVRHHLGRARAAEPGAIRARTPLAPAIDDLVAVLARIHQDRGVAVRVDVVPDLAVAIDPRDLDELLGNLLDNAWRHARARVAIMAREEGGRVLIAIEDDGTGLSDAAIAEAMLPGRRLDERGDGHGYGLPIARELAELNHGTLTLARGDAGGLHVTIDLPA